MIRYAAPLLRQAPLPPKPVEESTPAKASPLRPKLRLDLLAVLTEAAEHGRPCPTNEEIADLCGFASAGSISAALYRLEDTGLIIRTQINRHARTITIVASGKSTAPTRRPGRSQYVRAE